MLLPDITTILSPAESYDLVELDVVKQELKLTTTESDPWLSRAITQASGTLKDQCRRTFQIEQVKDQFYQPHHSQWHLSCFVKLARVPLAHYTVRLLSADASAGDTVLNFADSDGIDPATIVSGPRIALGSTVTDNTSNQVTLSLPLSAAMLAGTAIGFGIEVKETNPSRGLSADIDYQADVEAGQLLRLNQNFLPPPPTWNCGPWPLEVTYYAGYETIPPAIEEAAVRLVTMRWHARGRDPMLRERGQDSGQRESFWVGPTSRQSGAELPDEIEGLIKPYRRLAMVV